MSEFAPLQPNDEHNRRLRSHVHPLDWVNPKPRDEYHLVVLGAGTAGLVTAAGAAGLGARVALVERGLMGGDCLNVGCVPSKGLIRAARAAAAVRDAGQFGVNVPAGVSVDFAAAMERMRRLRAAISPNDSAARFRDLGVDVFFGRGRFSGLGVVSVNDTDLRYRKAVIATGSRPAAPPIPGLAEVDYLTNETVFSLTELPQRLGVIGAGPIGCELAQTFARFGSEVSLIESTHGILPREDADAAERVKKSLLADGVRLLCCGRELQLARDGNVIRLRVDSHDEHYVVAIDKLLVAAGRAPNVEDLGLETVGVAYDKSGVTVNDRLQTTNPKIFAAGDVCSPYKFTHAADFMARTVIRNSLLPWPLNRAKASDLVIPWCTYTSPEIAHVGISERDAQRTGIAIETMVQDLAEVDRAILEGDQDGLVKIHLKKGTDKILGATVVAANAGDMISLVTQAITHGLGLKKIADTIHPYPTQAEAIRKTGDNFRRTLLTPTAKKLLGIARWLAGMR